MLMVEKDWTQMTMMMIIIEVSLSGKFDQNRSFDSYDDP